MWTEKTKNGSIKYVERYQDPVTGEWKKVSKTYPKRSKGLDLIASEYLKTKIMKLTAIYSDKLTFDELINFYLEAKKESQKFTTYKTAVSSCKMLSQIIGHLYLSETNSIAIKKLLLNANNATKTRFNIISKWGFDNKIIKTTELLSLFKTTNKNKSKFILEKILDINEIKKNYSKCDISNFNESYCHIITYFLALTGLRIGECLALNVDDIKEDYIDVFKNLSQSKIITDVKNKDSIREVTLTAEIKNAINKYNELKIYHNINSNIIFCNKKGKYISYTLLSSTFKKIYPSTSIHSTRHTNATLLIEKGVDLNIIARHLGHCDTKMLQEVYAHITNNIKLNDRSIIRTALNTLY